MTVSEKIILEIEHKIKSVEIDLKDVTYNLIDYTRKADYLDRELQDLKELKEMAEKIAKNSSKEV